RAAERRDAADLHDPRDPVLPDGSAGDDADRVPDLVVVLRRGVRVDVDLVRADGPRARGERQRVEALAAVRVDTEGETRRHVAGDDLPVAADEAGEVADAAGRGGHAGEVLHLPQQRLGEGR